MKYDIFISYSRDDIEIAGKLCSAFDAYKEYYAFEYFFDCSEIKCVDEWVSRISNAIADSKVVLFVSSAQSTTSIFCNKELVFAIKHNKPVHQYRIDNSELPNEVDFLLGNQQYRELTNYSIEEMVREVLSNALQHDILSLSELGKSDNKATVVIDSNVRCRVLDFGEEIAVIEAGKGRLQLYKGNHKLTFVSTENEANKFEYGELDVRDVSYVTRIQVDLKTKSQNLWSIVVNSLKSKNPFSLSFVKKIMRTIGIVFAAIGAIFIAMLIMGLILNKKDKAVEQETATTTTLPDSCSTESTYDTMQQSIVVYEAVAAQHYKIGDYYNDGKKEGIVFEVSDDGRHGKIVSLTESEQWLTWYYKDSNILQLGAYDRCNGKANMSKIKQISNWRYHFPAFAWCANLGEDWYLPAIEELKQFTLNYNISQKVDTSLRQYGGTPLGYAGKEWHSYWSSTESEQQHDNKTCAWRVRMSDVSPFASYVHNGYYVRAVAKF